VILDKFFGYIGGDSDFGRVFNNWYLTLAAVGVFVVMYKAKEARG
jgi:hypothetical protein